MGGIIHFNKLQVQFRKPGKQQALVAELESMTEKLEAQLSEKTNKKNLEKLLQKKLKMKQHQDKWVDMTKLLVNNRKNPNPEEKNISNFITNNYFFKFRTYKCWIRTSLSSKSWCKDDNYDFSDHFPVGSFLNVNLKNIQWVFIHRS